jgi:hypothetical protein
MQPIIIRSSVEDFAWEVKLEAELSFTKQTG